MLGVKKVIFLFYYVNEYVKRVQTIHPPCPTWHGLIFGGPPIKEQKCTTLNVGQFLAGMRFSFSVKNMSFSNSKFLLVFRLSFDI